VPAAGFALALALATWSATGTRQASAQEPAGGAAPASGAAAADDKTGTNPLNLQRTALFYNEFQGRGGGRYTNFLNLRYIEPFADGKAAVRLTVPFVAQDLAGRGTFSFGDANIPVEARDGRDTGIGDLGVRLNYVLAATPAYGILVGLDSTWDTASGVLLGTGKNLLAPVIVYARFLPGGTIFAPAYQHYFTIGGDDSRARVTSGAFDFYYVKPARNGWWTLDPAVTINYGVGNRVAAQIELERGFLIGPQGKGVASWYIRPGVGIGRYRAYDWNIEAGYKVVGF